MCDNKTDFASIIIVWPKSASRSYAPPIQIDFTEWQTLNDQYVSTKLMRWRIQTIDLAVVEKRIVHGRLSYVLIDSVFNFYVNS